jgi:hypothetical protein
MDKACIPVPALIKSLEIGLSWSKLCSNKNCVVRSHLNGKREYGGPGVLFYEDAQRPAAAGIEVELAEAVSLREEK